MPGVEDFPEIFDGFYYILPFDFQLFRALNQMFSATRRSQNFTFPIFVDDIPEGVEELKLTLSLQPDDQLPEGAVNVTPSVATVRIQDFSCKFTKQYCLRFSPNKAVFKMYVEVND